MKQRILYLLTGFALIASLSFTSFMSPREANALPGPNGWPSACEVIAIHFTHYSHTGDWEMVRLLVAAGYDLGCY